MIVLCSVCFGHLQVLYSWYLKKKILSDFRSFRQTNYFHDIRCHWFIYTKTLYQKYHIASASVLSSSLLSDDHIAWRGRQGRISSKIDKFIIISNMNAARINYVHPARIFSDNSLIESKFLLWNRSHLNRIHIQLQTSTM